MRNPFAYRLTLTILAVLGLLFGFAVAEGAIELPPIDLDGWAKDVGLFSAFIFAFTGFVRKWFWKSLDGAQVPIFAIVVGTIIGALMGHFGAWFPTLWAGLTHGMAAGVLAVVGVDGLRSLFPSGGANAAAQNALDTAATRLRLK